MEDNEGFEVATGRKRRRIDSSNSSPAEKTYKKVFLKTDTGKLNAFRAQKEVSSLLCRNDVKIIPRNNLLIVLAKDDNEIRKLSSMSQINGIAVKALTENKPKHCIVGVPMNIDIADIIESVQCESAIRVTKTANGTKIPTSVVILNFKGQIPVKVKVGYLSFKIKPFIREPLRCYKCNAYGHIAINCKNNLKCPKCLGEHTIKECLNKEAEKRCATCDSTSHYTGQAVCPQRQIQKQVDTLRATKSMSYSQALKTVTQKVAHERKTVASQATDPSGTSSNSQENPPTSPDVTQDKKKKRKNRNKNKTKDSGIISQQKDENNVINNNDINNNKNLEGINLGDQISLSPDLLIRIIIKTAQAMIHRSHNGSPDLLGDMINHVGMIVLECMKEAGIPETVRATTEDGVDKANQHE